MSVILETSIGDITIDLYTKERPRCCLNFLKLCKIKYYNFCIVHNIQQNLVLQTGDPTGTGRGGESIYRLLYGDKAMYFETEKGYHLKHKRFGTVSMINNGSGMHGSQFFITLRDNIDYLDGQEHTVFGQVEEGFDILKKFNETLVDDKDRPLKDIRIFHSVVLDDPFEDPPGLAEHVPDRSPEPLIIESDNIRIEVDEDIDANEGLTEAQLREQAEDREAKANAKLLEMVGDLPDADVKPPDNVLFVCKLNPVTSAEDLEIIFSRFGSIQSCEVIKDQKSGESLQYAFIEFENEKDCENAYFKMDNVLIDDRRIHVDFSQSVSKIKWNRKGVPQGPEKTGKSEGAKQEDFVIKGEKFGTSGKHKLILDDNADSDSEKKHKKKKKKHESDSKKHKHHKKHKK